MFCDSREDHPGMDENTIEALITEKTVAIVPVHYAGVACDMEKIMGLAKKHGLFVVEDAAQAIDSYYTFSDGTTKALGSIGHLAAFSFHETKNIISGEGGMLAINDEQFIKRAEIIWEKGTNRSAFFRGEVNKYGWVDIGSSFLPSEVIAAFLWAQLENLESIQNRRKIIWERYHSLLHNYFNLITIPKYATNNFHIFYINCNSNIERSKLIKKFREYNVISVFHYLSLHSSRYYKSKHDGRELVNCDRYSDCLLRLPLFFELTEMEQNKVVEIIKNFIKEN